MSNEITIYESKPLSSVEIRANVNRIQEVMRDCMKKDVHYGVIPGTQKPTLFKAGSEKILATFRIAVEVEVEDMSTPDCARYRVKTRGFLPNGEVVGCGIGECSTNEEKYKWRKAVCKEEFDAAPVDRRRVKYQKGGYVDNRYDKYAIVQIEQIRTEPADLANTALKMAKKRAQIDLTLTATGASDVFDQDIEDLPAEYVEDHIAETTGNGKPNVAQPQAHTETKAPTGEMITDGQQKMIYAKLKAANLEVSDLTKHLEIAGLDCISRDALTTVVKMIEGGRVPKC